MPNIYLIYISLYCSLRDFMYFLAGSHAGGASTVTATVLSVRRADADTIPEDGHNSARRLPRVDPGRRGRCTNSCGYSQSRSRVRYHFVRDTSGSCIVAGTNQVRDHAMIDTIRTIISGEHICVTLSQYRIIVRI